MLKNTATRYGLIAVLLHWLAAIVVMTLFGLGLWMTELDYYDAWYQRAPDLHKSVGVLLFAITALRLVWRRANPVPGPLPSHTSWERRLARGTHRALYALLFATMFAGYLISTADGRALEVFGLFAIPATFSGFENQEDIAGEIHEILAFALIGLAGIHALAALKHHVVDRDATLKRIFGR